MAVKNRSTSFQSRLIKNGKALGTRLKKKNQPHFHNICFSVTDFTKRVHLHGRDSSKPKKLSGYDKSSRLDRKNVFLWSCHRSLSQALGQSPLTESLEQGIVIGAEANGAISLLGQNCGVNIVKICIKLCGLN